MRRCALRFAQTIVAIFAAACSVHAAESDLIGTAHVVLDVPAGPIFVGEMVLLHFRATLLQQPSLEELHQPSLADLNWKQLGRDVWTDIDIAGKPAYSYERTLAIFPQRTGQIIIEPFAYRVTTINRNNNRATHDITSPPVVLNVQQLPNRTDERSWLPAKSLKIISNWDMRPDRIPVGQVARRTIIIEAVGVGPEQMPSAPTIRSPGIIAFAGPVSRTVELTQNGPVTRATYVFDVKPVDFEPAMLPAVSIPWFDTINRVARLAIIPEQRVSFLSNSDRPVARSRERPARTMTYLAVIGLLSLVWSLAMEKVWSSARQWLEWRKRGALLRSMRNAASAGDVLAFVRALRFLLHSNHTIADEVQKVEEIGDNLKALDAHQFSRIPERQPDLRALYHMIAKIVLRENNGRLPMISGLAPIDGFWSGADRRHRVAKQPR
jgi:hypothetical protein